MNSTQDARRYRLRTLLAAGGGLVSIILAGLFSVAVGALPTSDVAKDQGGEPSRSVQAAQNGVATGETTSLLREGTRIQDQLGHFILTVDAAVFVNRDGRHFSVLKNLNLQRVMQIRRSTQSLEDIDWSVSGMVTEYGGENYLLMSRVIRKSKKSKTRHLPADRAKPRWPSR